MLCAKKFVELDKAIHERLNFDCGEEELNHFIKQQAVRHMKANISRTMVLPSLSKIKSPTIENHKVSICAFYTITPSSISRQQLPEIQAKKLPHYPIPVFLLAQLAVNNQCRGTGLGKITLIKALEHLAAINTHMRAYAVVVDCLTANAESFYRKFGFKTLGKQSGRTRLYLPMKQLEILF